jgi:hypothetical protein
MQLKPTNWAQQADMAYLMMLMPSVWLANNVLAHIIMTSLYIAEMMVVAAPEELIHLTNFLTRRLDPFILEELEFTQ